MAKAGRLGSSVGKISPPFSAPCLAAARQILDLGSIGRGHPTVYETTDQLEARLVPSPN